MRFSWIITTVWIYLVSILLYILMDSTPFWVSYFWIDTSLICIAGYLFNFIKRKTDKEMAFITFIFLLKTFNLTYYIIGLILDKQVWMGTNIFFLIVMAVSAFVSFLIYKSWKRN